VRNILKLSAAPALAIMVLAVFGPSAMAVGRDTGASASIVIDAPPSVVWDAVHEERMHDPELAYAKILERRGNSYTLEEKFLAIPIIGSVTAVLEQHEVPMRSINYSLLKSDKFKRMEGSWNLTPVAGGKTLLKLSSLLDVGVPFSGLFIRNATQRKIDRRLSNVKRVAERERARMASEGKLPI
jgi:hypothetical protein